MMKTPLNVSNQNKRRHYKALVIDGDWTYTVSQKKGHKYVSKFSFSSPVKRSFKMTDTAIARRMQACVIVRITNGRL